jgi:hypothetical protein
VILLRWEHKRRGVTIPRIRTGWPDRPGRTAQMKTQRAAHTTTRQQRYNEGTFSARLAEALRQHGAAVRTACTSLSVMRNITDQLARLASKEVKDSSNEDVPARHGLCSPCYDCRTGYHAHVHLAILRICDTRALDATDRDALVARC